MPARRSNGQIEIWPWPGGKLDGAGFVFRPDLFGQIVKKLTNFFITKNAWELNFWGFSDHAWNRECLDFIGHFLHFLGLNISFKIFPNSTQTKQAHATPTSHLMLIHKREPSQTHKKLQHLVDSLTWLAQSSWPDLAIIASIFAQNQYNPSQWHIHSTK